MSQRVLITGANGRLGRVLTDYLSERGHAVQGLVRANPAGANQTADASPAALVRLLSNCDTLVHMASTASADPASQRAVHVDLTEGLLAAAQTASLANFVYVSSIKALAGEHASQPLGIQTEPQPSSDYGRYKLQAEQAICRHNFAPGTQVRILRLPMVYGPGCKGNFDRLAGLVKRGLPVPVARDNARSMLSSTNLCAYIDALLNNAVPRPQITHQTIHLADPQPLSSAALTDLMAQAQQCANRSVKMPQRLGLIAGRLPIIGGYARRLFLSLIHI